MIVDEKLTQLAEQMELLLKTHEGLLGLVRRKQEAMRLGQAELVAETCELENEHVRKIAELEKRRQMVVGQITAELTPDAAEPLRLRDIADAVAEPRRGQLLVLHQQVRAVMERIQRENEVSKRAAEGLLRHVQGIVQQVTQVMGAATYGRRGGMAEAPVAMNSFSVTA